MKDRREGKSEERWRGNRQKRHKDQGRAGRMAKHAQDCVCVFNLQQRNVVNIT